MKLEIQIISKLLHEKSIFMYVLQSQYNLIKLIPNYTKGLTYPKMCVVTLIPKLNNMMIALKTRSNKKLGIKKQVNQHQNIAKKQCELF